MKMSLATGPAGTKQGPTGSVVGTGAQKSGVAPRELGDLGQVPSSLTLSVVLSL